MGLDPQPLTVALSVTTGLALATAAGFRAFVPLLTAGIAIHFGYVEAAPGFAWLGEPLVLVALAAANGFRRTGLCHCQRNQRSHSVDLHRENKPLRQPIVNRHHLHRILLANFHKFFEIAIGFGANAFRK